MQPKVPGIVSRLRKGSAPLRGHLARTSFEQMSWFNAPCQVPLKHVIASTWKYLYAHIMSEKKKWKELRRKLEQAGCEVIQPSGRSHLKVYRDGEMVAVLQQSNSCYQAY